MKIKIDLEHKHTRSQKNIKLNRVGLLYPTQGQSFSLTDCYSVTRREEEYYDEHVCLSTCISQEQHIQTKPNNCSCCLMHCTRLANTLLKDEESARDSRTFTCNFAKYSPI